LESGSKKAPNSEQSQNIRFIADAMLGRLAKWLRLLGYDTLYYKDISDAEVLRIAKQQNRIVLTRDTHFLNFRNFKDYFLIHSNNTIEQLSEMAAAFNLAIQNQPRCSKCNGILITDVEKESVKNLVPEYVYLRFKNFLRCAACGSIYWEGSHTKRFKKKFYGILKQS